MRETKIIKVGQDDVQGALSQARQVYLSLQNGGVKVSVINENGLSDADKMFCYLNAIHEAIGRNGLPVKAGQAASPPPKPAGQALPDVSGWKKDLKEAAIAVMVEIFGDKVFADEEKLESRQSVYEAIIQNYKCMIEVDRSKEAAVAEKNASVGAEVKELRLSIAPLIPVAQNALEHSKATLWSIFRSALHRWKSLPRWKNPYTYLYLIIGNWFFCLWILTWVKFNEVRDERDQLWRENQTHRIVDLYMSASPSYCKERGVVQDLIDNRGQQYSWQYIKVLRARHDSAQEAKSILQK